jgi:hypothetical protein
MNPNRNNMTLKEIQDAEESQRYREYVDEELEIRPGTMTTITTWNSRSRPRGCGEYWRVIDDVVMLLVIVQVD